MRKFIVSLIAFILIVSNTFIAFNVFAEETSNGLEVITEDEELIYKIYDEDNSFLFERQSVEIGDIIIDKNFFVYEITIINKENQTAIAKITKKIEKPEINKNETSLVTNSSGNKKIALYMTHNDESYIKGDGTESIYGEGGIHDIAKQLSKNLEDLGVNVTLNETLHLPHNSSAYSRSSKTAQKLLQDNPDAIFDIHRDGASRSSYVKKVNGIEKCQIMIVVGQANPNKETNLEFALYLMSVAEKTYPWLFKDIYYAKGHYNQALKNKSLLFECGSHNVEKSLVEQTLPYLAKTINTTLYNTTINEEGSINVNSNNLNQETTINNHLEEKNKETNKLWQILIIIIVLGGITYICYVLGKKVKLDKDNTM